jgi:hypothetical protein
MEQLKDLARNPYQPPPTCDHSHQRFTSEYDYQCLGCGQRFDNEAIPLSK